VVARRVVDDDDDKARILAASGAPPTRVTGRGVKAPTVDREHKARREGELQTFIVAL
jgi:hypothetical protein